MSLPQRLYKYQSYSSYALESLIQRKIWIASPEDFNDPFDCKIHMPEIENMDQLRALDEAWSKRKEQLYNPTGDNPYFPETTIKRKGYSPELLNQAAQLTMEQLTQLGVYSLTEMPADLLMWAHYANQHRGFVIGFDTSTLNVPDSVLIPVQYVDDYDEIPLDRLLDVDDMEEHLKMIALRKGRQWAHEKEWRLVYGRQKFLADMPMQPVRVIFGHRMRKMHRQTLRLLVSQHYEEDVEFQVANPSSTNYSVDIIPFTE